MDAKTRARERRLVKMAYRALRAGSSTAKQRTAHDSVPLQRLTCQLVSALRSQQKKCLMNSMATMKALVLEERLRREWQEKKEKDRKEVR